MAERPLVIPETYSGEGPFNAWLTHFENVAALNRWTPEQQLQWLAVRLVSRAQIAFQNLSAEARNSYSAVKEALQRRFDPESKRGLYAAEFHARQKQPTEDWPSFGEDLKNLVSKAFPDIEEAARERMALDRFLQQLGDPAALVQRATEAAAGAPQSREPGGCAVGGPRCSRLACSRSRPRQRPAIQRHAAEAGGPHGKTGDEPRPGSSREAVHRRGWPRLGTATEAAARADLLPLQRERPHCPQLPSTPAPTPAGGKLTPPALMAERWGVIRAETRPSTPTTSSRAPPPAPASPW